ncbi:MAG: hypothetical protein ACRED5_13740 [Propylenella sp.]
MSGQVAFAVRSIRFAFVFVVSVALAACTVSFVSSYDDVFDKSAADTQKKITLLLTELQKPGSQARRYANSAKTYSDIGADLHTLRVRAEANNTDGKNADTLTILGTIQQNMVLLEDEHRRQPSGPSPDFVQLAQRQIDVQFVSLIQFERAKKRGA